MIYSISKIITLKVSVFWKMSSTDGYFITITSVTINGCILLYCIFLKLRHHLASKTLGEQSRGNIFIQICKAYDDEPHLIAKKCVEQLVLLMLVLLSITALAVTDILLSPFLGDLQSAKKDFVVATLSIYTGKYVFTIVHNIYVIDKCDITRCRIDMIHHVTTLICYIVFLAREENLLLALVGILMELNMTVIEITKIKKKLNQTNSTSYKKLTALTCAITVTVRGIVPILFLVLCMFQETPFVMSYDSLTMFFVSLIFFSVINVWLILMSLQRLLKVSNKSLSNSSEKREQYVGTRVMDTNGMIFEKNNLGYLPRYDNKNISNKVDEKLNYTRKEFSKPQVCPQFEIQINQLSNEESVSNTSFSDSTLQSRHSNLEAQNVNLNVIIDNRASTNSSSSESSDSAMLSIRQDNVLYQSFRRSRSNETDEVNPSRNNVTPFTTSTVQRAASLPDLDGVSWIRSNALPRDEISEPKLHENIRFTSVTTSDTTCVESEGFQRYQMDSTLEWPNQSQCKCVSATSCGSFKHLNSSISSNDSNYDV